MKIIIILLTFLAGAHGAEFQVEIFDSFGDLLDDTTTHPLYVGDYIYCKTTDDVIGPLIYMAWVKVPYDDQNSRNKWGPTFVMMPSEEDRTNRLYLGAVFGNGFDTAYKCIATDQNPYENRDAIAGTNVHFKLSAPHLAGLLFKETDYAGLAQSTIDLRCVRTHPNARVVWRTGNSNNNLVRLLFDSGRASQPGLPDGYEWANNDADSDDFTLRITVSQETAIFHRCAVVLNLLTDVEATAMIYMIEPASDGCNADGFEDEMSVGTEVTFNGCHAKVTVNGEADLLPSDYSVVSYWNQDEDQLIPIDESRIINDESVYTVGALPETHDNVYSCGIQIHREHQLAKPAIFNDLCEEKFTFNVLDDTGSFRIYHGNRDSMDHNDYIRFNTLNRFKTEPRNNADLTCEFDRKPSVDGEVEMESKAPGSDTWEGTGSHVITGQNTEHAYQYRCVYKDDNNEDMDLVSGEIYMIHAVLDVEIFHNNELLEANTEYSFLEGDVIECRTTEEISDVYPPKYIWRKSINVDNQNGPQYLKFANNDVENNPFVMSYEYGLGELIEYRCVGTDDLSLTLIDHAGTPIRFRVQEAGGGGSDSGFAIQAGSTSLTAAILSYLKKFY